MPDPTRSVADPAAATGGAPAPPPAPAPASAGRYDLGDEIARGGMGAVYRATDTQLGREVAVKILAERFAPRSAAARRFDGEARIAAQLQHPGIPPVHDLGTLADGRPFLAMKLIKGDTLDALLAARPDPSADRGRFVAAFEQVCQAIAFAHAHGVIHRDLKPANVMVGSFGEVQVMDWGLAKVLPPGRDRGGTGDSEATAAATQIRGLRDADGSETQAGSVLGTPAYMRPEQAAGAVGKVDARSDVFGLGAILAVILPGQPPFAAGSAETARVKAALGDLAECFTRLDGCGADPDLVGLCRRCLSPRPADRPADAGEVARAVAALRQAADERARRAELDRVKAEGERAAADLRIVEQRKRSRLRLTLAGLVGVLVLAAGGVVWQVDRQRGRTAEAVASLLGQAEEALGAGDEAKAAQLLAAAEERAAEGGAGESADRLDRRRADLAVLRELDAADRVRWTPAEGRLPPVLQIVERYRAALRQFGADPEALPPEEVAARVAASAVRNRLVAALDLVLAIDRSPRVRAALRAADPNPFRDAVRDARLAGDSAKLRELAGRPEAADHPPEFVVLLADWADPIERRRRL